jgi:predicted alpha/beta-hydrolase family hydrolase
VTGFDYEEVPSASFVGPFDRAVLLAHGAGSDRNAPALLAVAARLRGAGGPAARVGYPDPCLV